MRAAPLVAARGLAARACCTGSLPGGLLHGLAARARGAVAPCLLWREASRAARRPPWKCMPASGGALFPPVRQGPRTSLRPPRHPSGTPRRTSGAPLPSIPSASAPWWLGFTACLAYHDSDGGCIGAPQNVAYPWVGGRVIVLIHFIL